MNSDENGKSNGEEERREPEIPIVLINGRVPGEREQLPLPYGIGAPGEGYGPDDLEIELRQEIADEREGIEVQRVKGDDDYEQYRERQKVALLERMKFNEERKRREDEP